MFFPPYMMNFLYGLCHGWDFGYSPPHEAKKAHNFFRLNRETREPAMANPLENADTSHWEPNKICHPQGLVKLNLPSVWLQNRLDQRRFVHTKLWHKFLRTRSSGLLMLFKCRLRTILLQNETSNAYLSTCKHCYKNVKLNTISGGGTARTLSSKGV
jgi:hypothetical protein